MRRLFWFAIGVGVAAFVVVKGRELMHKATPAAISEQVVEKGKSIVDRLQTFAADFSEAMDERESELREQLNM